MTSTINSSNTSSLARLKNHPQAPFFLLSCLLGAVMGVVFIMFQPMFGMDTLTSRHAGAYQKLGGLGATLAIVIAWLAHTGVSIFYGLLSGIVVFKYNRIELIVLYTLIFTWITTIIAPPANAMIVQLVSFQHIKFAALPALNFSFDVKFVLHLIFFAAISAVLYVYKKNSK